MVIHEIKSNAKTITAVVIGIKLKYLKLSLDLKTSELKLKIPPSLGNFQRLRWLQIFPTNTPCFLVHFSDSQRLNLKK